METDSPIFVTGMPRSGTTFVQHLLSQHPRIDIHGQEPADVHWGGWLKVLLDGSKSAASSNAELDYPVPHYAGLLDASTTAHEFLRFIRQYLTGGRASPRWGAKSLSDCRSVAEEILAVWPETRWIVCIRDPFEAIESLRSTFDRDHRISLEMFCSEWLATTEFALSRKEALPVCVHGLIEPLARRRWAESLLAFVGEEIAPEVISFVEQWPVVHQVVPASTRTYRLTEIERKELLEQFPGLRDWSDRMSRRCLGTEGPCEILP